MARKTRNRRKRQRSSAWFVEGGPETVLEFSRHRMIETLSAHQLEALQTLAGLGELQVIAQLAHTGSVDVAAVRNALAQLHEGRQDTVNDLLDRLGLNYKSLPPT